MSNTHKTVRVRFPGGIGIREVSYTEQRANITDVVGEKLPGGPLFKPVVEFLGYHIVEHLPDAEGVCYTAVEVVK